MITITITDSMILLLYGLYRVILRNGFTYKSNKNPTLKAGRLLCLLLKIQFVNKIQWSEYLKANLAVFLSY